jgi:hypothetical protein|tara:strand:+ start:98 stop:343 length:246 start_codon:yes stop_codon:yes gene_type:complete
MIGKISWELNAVKDEMKIIKVDYLAWPKSSRPEHIKEMVEYYKIGKSITVEEFCTNPRYNEIMCTVISYDPLHHNTNVINI